MFKASVILTLATAVCIVEAQTKLDLFSGDEKVGVGAYKESSSKGRLTREYTLWKTGDDGSKTRLIYTKVMDSNAFPIREEEQLDKSIGKVKWSKVWRVRYDDSGAALVSEQIGKTKVSERIFMPTPGYSRADASDLWFTKTHPLPGTTVKSTVFDIEDEKWQVVETTFIGRKWITVGGRQIEANEVRDSRDGQVRRVYLDDRGQPVLMVNGALRTEKHF